MTRALGAGTADRGLWRRLRILFLLLVLLLVAATTWQQRYLATRWSAPLYVAIYPIAGDESPVTLKYLANLDPDRFKPIDSFFVREAQRHQLTLREPVRTRLRPRLRSLPPTRAADAGMLGTAWWSLRLRFWAWKVSRHVEEPEDIRMFVLFHDPALSPTVPHSLGLTKGLIGVVYAYAEPAMNGANAVVIAHELLHTVGASDKYNPADNAPLFPSGYGDAKQEPLLPQRFAEIMAGRRMLAADRWEQIDSLDEAVVGGATALEIRWRKL